MAQDVWELVRSAVPRELELSGWIEERVRNYGLTEDEAHVFAYLVEARPPAWGEHKKEPGCKVLLGTRGVLSRMLPAHHLRAGGA